MYKAYQSSFDIEKYFIFFENHPVGIFSYFFLIMNEYDHTFNPNILIGHYDLISWFSDFALYLNTEWVYDHFSFTL